MTGAPRRAARQLSGTARAYARTALRPLLLILVFAGGLLMAPSGCSREPRQGEGKDNPSPPKSRVTLRFELAAPPVEPLMALRKAERTIKARLAAAHIAGATVSLDGPVIKIALPLMTAPEVDAVRALVTPVGRLELSLVDESADPLLALADAATSSGEGAGVTVHRGGNPSDIQFDAPSIPAFTSWLLGLRSTLRPDNGRSFKFEQRATGVRAYLIEPEVRVSGSSLFDATPVENGTDVAAVRIYLDGAGTEALDALTATYQGRRLAIVLDDRILVAATIGARIRGGQALITLGERAHGEAGRSEAARLAALLRAGALPGPLRERLPGKAPPR